MRADTLVHFVKGGEEIYNPSTGNYEQGDPVKTPIYALVTDTGTQRMSLLYGGVRQYAKTIRLNQIYNKEFDHVEIDGKSYQVDVRKTYRHKTTFEVSGL